MNQPQSKAELIKLKNRKSSAVYYKTHIQKEFIPKYTKPEYSSELKNYHQSYYQKNKEHLLQYQKELRDSKKDKIDL